MKNIAIVGTGGIASQHSESYLHFSDRSRIVALCDIDSSKMAARATEYGLSEARLYTDYQEMLADPKLDLDIVSITTPPFTHRDIAVAVVSAIYKSAFTGQTVMEQAIRYHKKRAKGV